MSIENAPPTSGPKGVLHRDRMIPLNATDQELLAVIGRLYVEGLLLRAKIAELQAQVDQLTPKPDP